VRVEGWQMLVRTNADEAIECYNVVVPGSAELVGCSSVRGIEAVATMQDGTERFAAL